MPKKSLDALLLFFLVIAKVEIDTLADNVLPDRIADVQNLVASWRWQPFFARLDHPQTDAVTMMLYVLAFGILLAYVLVSVWMGSARRAFRFKLTLIYAIIGVLVFGKTALLINLRHQSVPWSYSHDGGVIQTESTIDYFLSGKNPYVEDYVDTPMAQWGINEYRTALYHYPYLPLTFVFSAPFYTLANATIGWFDERMVYLLLFALMLALIPKMVRGEEKTLLAVMFVGLNPIMAEDVIFGANDPFVLFWLVLAVWLLGRQKTPSAKNYLLASAALGLASASKPTAWFLTPFWLLYLLKDVWGARLIPPPSRRAALAKTALRRAWTLPAVALVFILPWLLWDAFAMYDDVWRWSAGQGETGYQIWGWGASNLVLGFGWVADRFAYFPFIIPQAIVSVPLLVGLAVRQLKENTIGTMLMAYVVFLLVFFFLSRFLQPNYLGFLGSVLALAYFIDPDPLMHPAPSAPPG